MKGSNYRYNHPEICCKHIKNVDTIISNNYQFALDCMFPISAKMIINTDRLNPNIGPTCYDAFNSLDLQGLPSPLKIIVSINKGIKNSQSKIFSYFPFLTSFLSHKCFLHSRLSNILNFY